MSDVEIYTKPWCPYTGRAKNLLDRRGISYKEIDVTLDPRLENRMKLRSQRQTVPQVFINGIHIGGSDDLIAADKEGLLRSLLTDENAVVTEIWPPTGLA